MYRGNDLQEWLNRQEQEQQQQGRRRIGQPPDQPPEQNLQSRENQEQEQNFFPPHQQQGFINLQQQQQQQQGMVNQHFDPNQPPEDMWQLMRDELLLQQEASEQMNDSCCGGGGGGGSGQPQIQNPNNIMVSSPPHDFFPQQEFNNRQQLEQQWIVNQTFQIKDEQIQQQPLERMNDGGSCGGSVGQQQIQIQNPYPYPYPNINMISSLPSPSLSGSSREDSRKTFQSNISIGHNHIQCNERERINVNQLRQNNEISNASIEATASKEISKEEFIKAIAGINNSVKHLVNNQQVFFQKFLNELVRINKERNVREVRRNTEEAALFEVESIKRDRRNNVIFTHLERLTGETINRPKDTTPGG